MFVGPWFVGSSMTAAFISLVAGTANIKAVNRRRDRDRSEHVNTRGSHDHETQKDGRWDGEEWCDQPFDGCRDEHAAFREEGLTRSSCPVKSRLLARCS